jgi:hypothetical protein
MDRSNQVADLGQRLGFFAYMTVMSGGRPFWPALLETSKAIEELAASVAEPGGSASDAHPFVDTVPYAYQRDERDHIAA